MTIIITIAVIIENSSDQDKVKVVWNSSLTRICLMH